MVKSILILKIYGRNYIKMVAKINMIKMIITIIPRLPRNVPDVIGLVGRREGAVESRARSVGVLVPDCRGLDQNLHDVTIVDMGDVPELHVSLPELSSLIHKWPPAVINHMGWCQRELEAMRAAAKTKYRQSRPSCCTFCGILIKCDMYQHVARCHLDLAQLWRCPVPWCTCGRARLRI